MSQALYQRIAASLRQRILSGGHAVGDVMPSENELAGAYRTSRVTVRRAFQVLESEGLIRDRQGKGYQVLPPRHTVFTLTFDEAADRDNYRFLEVNIVPPELSVSRVLRLSDGHLVIDVRRLLERNGVPAAYDEKFIPYERGKPSIELELRYSEFPDLFASRFASVSLRTEMRIGIDVPPAHARAALGCGEEERLMVVERLILTLEGERVGFSRMFLTPAFGPLYAESGHVLEGNPGGVIG